MRHEAIRELYPEVVTIDDEAGAFDVEGKEVDIDDAAVDNRAIELESACAAKAQKALDKMTGIEFGGVMCSAKSKDMYGLKSIKDWVKAGNDTVFKFQNGNELPLTSANIDAFEAVWSPFRASFFG